MKLKNITEDNIRDIADSTAILARGLDYYETGQVKSIDVEDEMVIAKVAGSYGNYDVEISIEDGEICADCDCPYDGYGCKHIVAVLYKLLDKQSTVPNKKIAKSNKRKEIDIKQELSKLNKDELTNTLLTLCQNYEDVRRDITLKISRKVDTTGELKNIIFKQIEDALYTRDGFIDYYAVFDVVKRLEEIKDSILQSPPYIKTQLLKQLVRKTMPVQNEGCDDSSGSMGEFVIECLTELGKSIHEQNLPSDEKKKIIQENFDALEKEQYGLENGYISLLLEIPSTKKDFDFMIKEIKIRMEKQKEDYEKDMYKDMLTEIYKKAGKDKEYLEILEENANKEGTYLPLAEFWKEKGNIKRSIEVAEKGIKTKREQWDGHANLFEFLEEIYRSQNKKEDLLRILLLHFKERPTLLKYKEIMRISEKLNKWEKLKNQLIQRAKGQALIEIYLFEKELEKAFNVLMTSPNRYSDRFRDKVAKALIQKFPEKSLKIYLSIVKQFIDMGKRDTYKIASLYAKQVKEIYQKLGQKNKWIDYVSLIREENKRRPALIDEFRRL
jgi:uncharacterized Zn finger protein